MEDPSASPQATVLSALTAPEFAHSPTAKRLHDVHSIGWAKAVGGIEDLIAIHEQPDVGPDVPLLIEHSEPQPRVLTIKIGQKFGESRAGRFYLPRIGIRAERRGNQQAEGRSVGRSSRHG